MIPQIVQQTTVLGGGGDYSYRAITGHVSQAVSTLVENGAVNSVSYAMSGFQGVDLDPAGIRKLYVKIEGKQGGDAFDTGDTEVWITYPDGTEHLVFRWDPVNTSISDTEFADMIEVPIARDQLTFDIRLATANFSGSYDFLRTTIVGAEEYVSNGNAGLSWTLVEKQPNGVVGTTLPSDTWTPIPFNDEIGTNHLQGASNVGSDITVPAGKYELTLMLNLFKSGYGIHEGIHMRMWNVTTGELIQRLPNISPMVTIDYYGNGHDSPNAQTVVIDVDFAEETTFRFEAYPNGTMVTGQPGHGTLEEYYSRLRIVGGASLTPAGTWDFDSGWVAEWGNAVQSFVHNLATDTPSSVLIQMKDGNNVPLTFYGSQYNDTEDYFISYGHLVTHPNANQIDVQKYQGIFANRYWLCPYTNRPGWANPNPTHIRVLIRR